MNLLIVDDDIRFVDSIVESIAWKKIGIDMTFTANSVKQAKTVLLAYSVQILLTDIEMVQGSGLELMEWIREQNLLLKCIVLSSYAKFSYAQKAIELDVSEYLLKPVKFKALEETIKKVAETIPVEKEDLKYKFYSKILMEPSSRERVFKWGKEGNIINKRSEYVILSVLRIMSIQTSSTNKIRENEILDFVVRNVIQEILGQKGIAPEAIVQNINSDWYIIIKDHFVNRNILDEMILDFNEKIRKKTVMYVSRPFALRDIITNREELDAVSMKYLAGPKDILYVADLKNKNAAEPTPPWEEWKQNFFTSEDQDNVIRQMKNFLTECGTEFFLTFKWLHEYRKRLVMLMMQVLEQRHLDFFQIFNTAEYDSCYERSLLSVDYMKDFTDWLFTRLNANRMSCSKKEILAESVMAYVKEHLSEELSRKRIADMLYVSEDYVGKTFIAVTGKSISEYVAEQRMKTAKRELEQTARPVSQIAMTVGINNFSYFSKMFKDYAGYTPNEYRFRYNREQKDSKNKVN